MYIVNLSESYNEVRNKRAGKAVKILRKYLAKHMKVDEKNVVISAGVNSLVWRDSVQKPQRKIKIRCIREGEKATAWIIGEEENVKKEEERKKEEEKKKEAPPEKKKEERKAEKPEKSEEEKKLEKIVESAKRRE
ncbi:MAG: 50S ribosomal protein L31e [Candidatus Micrarchaeota archaeon]